MKSIIFRLVLALAAFAIVPDALAADTGGGNIFLDAKFGTGSNGSDFTDTGYHTVTHSSWGADGGYLWKLDDTSSVGLDLGYMHFGTVADSVDANGFFTEQVSATAMMAGGRLQVLFGADKDWVFQARAGWMRAKLDASIYSYPPDGLPPFTSSESWHESGKYFGLGIGRQITQSFSLIVAFNRYNASDTTHRMFNQINLGVSWIGLQAEYRF